MFAPPARRDAAAPSFCLSNVCECVGRQAVVVLQRGADPGTGCELDRVEAAGRWWLEARERRERRGGQDLGERLG